MYVILKLTPLGNSEIFVFFSSGWCYFCHAYNPPTSQPSPLHTSTYFYLPIIHSHSHYTSLLRQYTINLPILFNPKKQVRLSHLRCSFCVSYQTCSALCET